MWMFHVDKPIFFILCSFISGIIFTFFGYRMLGLTIITNGILSGIAISVIIGFSITATRNPPSYYGWIVFASSIGIGILVAAIYFKVKKVGMVSIGVWAGIMVSLALHALIFHKWDSIVLFWTLNTFFATLGGCLLHFWGNAHLIIGSTSITGSYLLIRGVSILIGHYPNEFTLIEMLRQHIPSPIGWPFYIYLIVFKIIFLTGVLV